MLLQKWLMTVGTQAVSPQLNSDLLYLYGYDGFGQLGNNSTINAISPVQLDTRSWAQIATGMNHTLALRSDSYLFAWGENDTGQIGDKTTVNKSSPVQLGGGFWNKIATKNNTSYGIRNDGKLYAWGQSVNGELGINDFATPSLAKSWTMLAMGDSHTVALRSDGMLFSWGNGVNGQLGYNDRVHRSSQVQIGTSSWVHITAGSGYSAAIRSDGMLFAWGINTGATLGDGTVVNRSSPVQIGTSSWTQVQSGILQTTGIAVDGTLYTWGASAAGQLGQGVLLNRSSPVQVTSLLSESDIESYAASAGIEPYPYSWTLVQTGAGSGSAYGIQVDGSLWSWGYNTYGELGNNSTNSGSSPAFISSGSWVQIATAGQAASIGFAVGLKTDGSVWVWGNNTNGQLGLEDTVQRSSPVQLGTSSWTQVTAGSNTAYMLRTDGALFAIGLNNVGQVGDGTTVHRSSPVQIGTYSWTSVNGGTSMVSAIRSDGLLFTWGLNTSGGLGDGSSANKSSPVQITSLWSDADQIAYNATLESPVAYFSWSQISSGISHTLAIRNDGMLFAWGDNTTGQLGTDDTISESSPTMIGNSSWIVVSAYTSSAAIRSDGLLFTWGNGANNGQLGQGDLVDRSSPTQLGTSSWTSVNAGFNRFFAITSAGSLFAWGANTNGQLGDNTTTTRSSPVLITTDSWVIASADSGANGVSSAIRSDGLLFAWGTNANGQIGDGSLINKSAPVQITSLTNQLDEQSYAAIVGYTIVNQSWTQIIVGPNHTVAIRDDGRLFAWGLGTTGQLGNDTSVSTSSPIPVGTSSWTSISVGVSHTTAVRIDGKLFTWGANNLGQLGLDDNVHRSSPTQVGTLSWIDARAGVDTTLGITDNSLLYSWGSNVDGILGLGDRVHRSSPVQVGTSSWTATTVSDNVLAITTTGLLFAWGSSTTGGIGQGTIISRSSPVQISSIAGNEVAINSYVAAIGYSGTVYNSWTSIATGIVSSYAIRSDGMLFAWGANESGQLGDNTTVDKSSPIMIGTSSWLRVGAGAQASTTTNYAIALRADGAIFTWGNATSGVLGTGDVINRSSPVQIGTSSWTQISAGEATILALRQGGSLFVWGGGLSGRLGTNDAINRSSPVQLGTSSWTQVSAGGSISAAIRADGGLFTWGLNTTGAMGSNTIVSRSSPVQVGTSSWIQVSAAQMSMYAIRLGGGLFSWGTGNLGRLGSNSSAHRSSPVQVGTSSWTQVAGGDQEAYAIRSDGAMFAWGDNAAGQLGLNDLVTRSSPVQIGTSSWTQVNTAKNSGALVSTAVALRSDGRLFAWGLGTSGQLGNMRLGNYSSPVVVATINDSWSVVSTGDRYSTAIRNDRILFGWGLGNTGQIGDSTAINRSAPVQVGNDSWVTVSAGLNTTYGLRYDYSLFAWGAGVAGQIGDGTLTNKSSPVKIGTSSWVVVNSRGSQTVSAIRSDGLLFLWGSGATGQIGNYRLANYNSPIQLATVNDSWSVVSAGGSFTAAIRSDKLLYTWGLNTLGRLGDGTVVDKSIPTLIGSDSWLTVSAGSIHTLALRSDNLLFAWGAGGGQIGDSTATNKSSPVQIGTSSWAAISAGLSFSAGIETDGSLYTWGSGISGQLGTLRLTSTSSPVIVKSITDSWNSVSTGEQIVAAVRSDGLMFTWGNNGAGQLGDNTAIPRSAPVQLGAMSWAQVSAGSSHMAGLTQDYTLYTWGLNTLGQLGDGTSVNKSSPVQIGTTLPDGYYSYLFPNAVNYLSVPNSSVFNFGSNSFTIEAFIYPTTVAGENVFVSLYGYTADRRAWYFGMQGSTLEFRSASVGTTAGAVNGSTVLTANRWYHVAAVKTGSTVNIYLNGVLDGSGSAAATIYNNTVDPVYIGAVGPNLTGYYNGYISNLRILNGTALYTANFTPPTSPLTNITNTVLLTCQSNVFVDNSSNNFTISQTDTSISVTGPFSSSSTATAWTEVTAGTNFTGAITTSSKLYMWGDNQYGQLGIVRVNNTSSPVIVKGISDRWSSTSSGGSHMAAIRSDNQLYTWGGNTGGQLGDVTVVNKPTPTLIGFATTPDGYYSVSFNGTSNYLQIANATPLIFGTGNFTIEAWVYPVTLNKIRAIYSKNGTSTSTGSYLFSVNSAGKVYIEYNNSTFITGTITIPLNQWTHVAWSKSSGVSYIFVNGVLDTTIADTNDYYGVGVVRVGFGRGSSASSWWNGKLSNVRAIKGVGLYTSTFIPMGPLTAIENTVLLTCQSATIKDNSINNYTIVNN